MTAPSFLYSKNVQKRDIGRGGGLIFGNFALRNGTFNSNADRWVISLKILLNFFVL